MTLLAGLCVCVCVCACVPECGYIMTDDDDAAAVLNKAIN